MPDPGGIPELRASLLGWYRRVRRDLPWRRDADDYRVWVSEVMLQQTTVRAVAPYFERFLARFPTVHALAVAGEEDVLAAWSGLGYYHRARNLHRGARHVVERHGGRFPRSVEAALAVPGVGPYTAGAVLSIAYGEPVAALDGNVRRVTARLFAVTEEGPRGDAACRTHARELLETRAPGDWNQAVMELGATVCTPRRPRCGGCPVAGHCRAHARGEEASFPRARTRRAPVQVTVAAAIVERHGRVLLVRRAEGRLMGRLWEIPQTSLEGGGAAGLEAELRERHGLHVEAGALLARAAHAITFRRIRLEAYRARLRGRPPADSDRFRWVAREEVSGLAVSSLTHKVLRATAVPQGSTGYRA